MKYQFVLIILVLSNLVFYQAEAGNEIVLFTKANELYRQGKFDEALTSYLQLEKDGYESAELYYNIGNAYYKKGDLPHSILYFERAKITDSNDEDVQFNLRLVNTRTVDKITPKPEIFYVTWWRNFTYLLSLSSWTFLSIASTFLIAFSIGVYLFARRPYLKKAGFILFFLFFIASLIFYLAARRIHREKTAEKYAVIFSPTVTVKSSPDDKGTDLFVLHEGTKLKISDKIGDWYQIQIADGNKGWIRKVHFELI